MAKNTYKAVNLEVSDLAINSFKRKKVLLKCPIRYINVIVLNVSFGMMPKST